MTENAHLAARKRLQRLLRYGSHRVKVGIRRIGSKNHGEAAQAAKGTRGGRLVGRLVVSDLLDAVMRSGLTPSKPAAGKWFKDEFADELK